MSVKIDALFSEREKNFKEAFQKYDSKQGWSLSFLLTEEHDKYEKFADEYIKDDTIETTCETDFIKYLLILITDYFEFLFEKAKAQSDLNPKEKHDTVEMEYGSPSPDMSEIMNRILEKTFELADESPWKVSQEDKEQKLKALTDIVLNYSKHIKDSVKNCEIDKEEINEILKFSNFQEDNKKFTSSFLLEIKKSYINFLDTGKCSDRTFPFVLAMFADYLSSNKLEKKENIFSERVTKLFYAIAFLQNSDFLLTTYSNYIMNHFLAKNLKFQLDRLNDGIEDKVNLETRLESVSKNYPEQICLTQLKEKDFINILYFIREEDKKCESLIKLYEYCFNPDFSFRSDYEKEWYAKDALKDLWKDYDEKLSEYPGIIAEISILTKFLSREFLQDFFAKKEIFALKEEWFKLEKAKERAFEKYAPLDLETFAFIYNPETQKKQTETFEKRNVLLQSIFFFQVYSLFIDEEPSLTDSDFNKNLYDLIFDFHNTFLRKDYLKYSKLKEMLSKVSQFLFKKDLFESVDINFLENSSECVNVVYYISKYGTDKMHSFIDFINHVREKQIKNLPVVPNTYATYTKEEAETQKQKLIQNQKVLHEKIDPGFSLYCTQGVSEIHLQEPSVIERQICMKSFLETDKEYEIYYYQKNKFSQYVKFAKKENFRITNKNLLENHYLYPDRNIFTHDAANYMVIESLLDEDKAESLLFALYDIKKFLNATENEIKHNKQSESGIIYLQNEFREITKEIWHIIIFNHFTDPWKEIFYKDELKPEYKERIKNLDYMHDFGERFLLQLNKFLVKIYNLHSDTALLIPVHVFFYLMFQNFILDNIKN